MILLMKNMLEEVRSKREMARTVILWLTSPIDFTVCVTCSMAALFSMALLVNIYGFEQKGASVGQ